MRVPVVVVNELDGLSKVATGRGQDHQTLEHQGMVRDKARTALAWLRERPAHVKCVTSKGGRDCSLPLLPNVLNLVVCPGSVLSCLVVHALNKMKYAKINSATNNNVKKGVIFSTYSSLIGESQGGGKYKTR